VRGGLTLAAAAVLFAIAAVALVLASDTVDAHAPEGLTLVFDDRTDVLTVSVRHNVKDRTTHYVSSVEVWLNGGEAYERPYTSQSAGTFTLRVRLDAQDGDAVMVKAYCVLGGVKEEAFTVAPGINEAGTNAGRVGNVVMTHAAIQVVALVLAVLAMPGGLGFLRAFRTGTAPKGRRKLHARIGMAAVALWVVGALGGAYIVYMTSGMFLASPHGWLAIGTVALAAIAVAASSPRFKSAGYGARITTHAALGVLTALVAAGTILLGLMAFGVLAL